MPCQDYFGAEVHSDVIPFAPAGANINIETKFMATLVDNMSLPMIDEAAWRLILVLTVPGGNVMRGELVPQALQNINVMDVHGDRFVCEGASARIIAQVVYGQLYSDELDLAAGAFTIEHWLPMPVRIDLGSPAEAPSQTRIAAEELKAGKITFGWSGAVLGVPGNTATITTAGSSVQLFLTGVDEYEQSKTKVRVEFHDKAIVSDDTDYTIGNHRLLYFGAYFGVGNQNIAAGPNPWPTQQITSKTLGFTQELDTYLRHQYKFRRRSLRTQDAPGATTLEDENLRGLVLPICSPRPFQSMPECPNINNVIHYKTNLPFNAGNFTSANAPRFVYFGYTNYAAQCGGRHGRKLGAVIDLKNAKIDPSPASTAPTLVNKLPREIVGGPVTLTKK